jgi:excisionase family DNA binding protein
MQKSNVTSEELIAIQKEIQVFFSESLAQFLQRDKEEHILLSRKDTAKKLYVSLPTLHDWTKTGIIKAHRIGGRILYKLNEIHDALEEIQTSRTKEVKKH